MVGRVEYVNRTRDFFNHISLRNNDTKQIENYDLENDVSSWSYVSRIFMDEEEKLKVGDDRDQSGGGRRRFWREMPIHRF